MSRACERPASFSAIVAAWACACVCVVGCDGCWGASSVPQAAHASKAPPRRDKRQCPRFAPPVVAGRVQSSEIDEASGLALSPTQPGIMYTHNDSGDSSRVFAIDRHGRLRAVITLELLAIDWEDMASARIDGKSVLFVGDIGDNWRVRGSVRVHRFDEPALPDHPLPTSATIRASGVKSYSLRYGDDAHDAEALLVDPIGRDLYIVTKTVRVEKTLVLRVPLAKLSTRKPVTMTRVATINVWRGYHGDRVSGGDFSPSGDLLALRTYRDALIWPRHGKEPVAKMLAQPPCRMALHDEPQGEAIAVGHDGFYTLSEKTNQPLYFYRRLR